MTSQQAISSQTATPSPASNPNLNPAAKPAPNSAVGGNGGFQWGQSGTGSVSIAYGAIMELMALMTQIQSMNSQQAGYSTQAAGYAAEAAYKQSMSAADQSQKAGILNAATSFVSGGLAIIGAGMSMTASVRSQPKLTVQSNEKAELNNFSKQLTENTLAKPTARVGTEATRSEPGVEDRIKLLTSTDADNVTTLANAQKNKGSEQELNRKAIACMTPSEAEKFGSNLTSAEETNSRTTHDINNSMNTTQQQISMIKETITGITNGSLTVVSTGCTTQEKTDQATASLEQAQSQQLYGMYNNQAQQATQNQGKVLEALQILAQLNQVRA
jgi:hypothetical protein